MTEQAVTEPAVTEQAAIEQAVHERRGVGLRAAWSHAHDGRRVRPSYSRCAAGADSVE